MVKDFVETCQAPEPLTVNCMHSMAKAPLHPSKSAFAGYSVYSCAFQTIRYLGKAGCGGKGSRLSSRVG